MEYMKARIDELLEEIARLKKTSEADAIVIDSLEEDWEKAYEEAEALRAENAKLKQILNQVKQFLELENTVKQLTD